MLRGALPVPCPPPVRILRLPVNSLLLLSNQLVFNLGFYMVVPFLAAYLRDDLALAGASIGLVLGLRTFCQQGLFVFGGALSDRLGTRRLILLGCVVRVMGFLCLGMGGSLPMVVAGACLTGVGGALFSPAISTLVAQLGAASEAAGKRTRAQYFALLAVWGESGAVLGPLLGALLIGIGFQAIALIGAAVFVVAGFVLGRFLPVDTPARPATRRGLDWGTIFTDRLFMAFIVAHAGFLFSYNQLYLALPVEISRSGGSDRDLAPLFMVASLLVIGLQLPIARLARWAGYQRSLPLGFLLMAAGFVIVAIAAPHAAPTGLMRLAPAVGLVVLLSLGHMAVRPVAMDLVPDFAQGRALGVYYGALASSGGVAVLLGNVALGGLLDSALLPHPGAALPWYVLAAVPATSAMAMVVILRRLTQRRTVQATA